MVTGEDYCCESVKFQLLRRQRQRNFRLSQLAGSTVFKDRAGSLHLIKPVNANARVAGPSAKGSCAHAQNIELLT